MEQSKKPETIMAVALIVLIAALTFMTYQSIFYSPKFKVDDCIVSVTGGNEFEAPTVYGRPIKILEVGKQYYKTTVEFKGLNPDAKFETLYIRGADNNHQLTDCTGAE
jgi:hypothetical protein